MLDHILIGAGLLKLTPSLVEIEAIHVNADHAAANRLSDHDPVVARFKFEKE